MSPAKRSKQFKCENSSSSSYTAVPGAVESIVPDGAKLCPICGAYYSTNRNLRRHITNYHKDINVDNICPVKHRKRVTHSTTAVGSITSPTPCRACPICGVYISTNRNLRRHITNRHKDINVDNICPVKHRKRVTNSTTAVGSITSPTPCKTCPICGVNRSTGANLRRHISFCHKDVDVDYIYPVKRKKRVPNMITAVGSITSPAPSKSCPICGVNRSTVSNLRRHISVCHKDVCPVNYKKKRVACTITGGGSLTSPSPSNACPICGVCSSKSWKLRRHISNCHKDINVDDICPIKQIKRVTSAHVCTVCSKSFSFKTSLLHHIRFSHTHVDEYSANVHRKSPVQNLCRLRCPVCSSTLPGLSRPTMTDLIMHLNEAHDKNIQHEYKSFSSDAEFVEWLTRIQSETPCNFLKQSRKGGRVAYYYCSRSGPSRCEKHLAGARRRLLKIQGSFKTGYTCPAHMIVSHKNNDHITVKYAPMHFCHTDKLEQLGHIRLLKADRNFLAGKLALQIPIDAILRSIRGELVDDNVLRRHIATKKDLRNIERAFDINRSERANENDATSVDTLVRFLQAEEDSPVILYKRQGVGMIDVGPVDVPAHADEDFLLALMNDVQCHMLKRYATGDLSVVCVDSTHGTNGYLFDLTTLMVLDDNREGYPVAFLYSNRTTEVTLKTFFEAIREKSGVIISKTFMSDMAPAFWNAWKMVMGECEHRLFCAWHVDKIFRQKTKELIQGDCELAKHVYKQIRTLMEEQDVMIFEAALPVLMNDLESEPSTTAFGMFFRLRYSNCAKAWAYCYRAHSGVNTNMHLERMHGILKHHYLNGKKNKRLDIAVSKLLNFAYDKSFDRLTTICKGKYSKKLSLLRKRHNLSITLDVVTGEVEPDHEWFVHSEHQDDEIYAVKRLKNTCSCSLQCKECSACIHTHICSCPDNATAYNMCKHIHHICTKYKLTNIEQVDSDRVLFNSEDGQSETSRNVEAAMHIAQLSGSSLSFGIKRETARLLSAEVANLVETVQREDQLTCLIASLRMIKPKLCALEACHSVEQNFVQTAECRAEPANKHVEPQRPFTCTKKTRAECPRKSAFEKPKWQEKNLIKRGWLGRSSTTDVNAGVNGDCGLAMCSLMMPSGSGDNSHLRFINTNVPQSHLPFHHYSDPPLHDNL